MRIARAVLGVMVVISGMATGQVVGANQVIPVPAPSSERGRWTDGPGRFRVELETGGATLRGWDYKPGATAAAKPGATAIAGAEEGRGALGRGGDGIGMAESGGVVSSTTATGAAAGRGIPVVVFFNGNLMTIERADDLYRKLSMLGVEVVVYDYRGYGFSEGQPDVGSFRSDALAIYDKVVKEYAGRRVLVYGFSLGTAMAAYVASERRVDGVVLAAPFATAEEEMPVFARRMGFGPEAIRTMVPGDDAKVAFDEVGMMRRSSAPLLVLSGSADVLVPMAQGRKVEAASPAREKRFVELRGAQHHETVYATAAWEAIGRFCARCRLLSISFDSVPRAEFL